MNPASIDIKDLLEQESSSSSSLNLDLEFGTNLFISHEPDSPQNCVTVYDAPGGFIDSTLQAGNQDYFYADVQVRVRNTNYLTGMALACNIQKVLHGLNNFMHGTTYYAFIRCTTPPFMLEWDTLNRAIIIINFQIQRR